MSIQIKVMTPNGPKGLFSCPLDGRVGWQCTFGSIITLGSIIPNDSTGLSSCPLANEDGCQPIIWSMTPDGLKCLFSSQLAREGVRRLGGVFSLNCGPWLQMVLEVFSHARLKEEMVDNTSSIPRLKLHSKDYLHMQWGGGGCHQTKFPPMTPNGAFPCIYQRRRLTAPNQVNGPKSAQRYSLMPIYKRGAFWTQTQVNVC